MERGTNLDNCMKEEEFNIRTSSTVVAVQNGKFLLVPSHARIDNPSILDLGNF